MKCKDCSWWVLGDDDSYRAHLKIGVCHRADMFDQEVEYVKEKGGFTLRLKDPDVKMYVQDGSSYYAELLTEESFFCYHFKQCGTIEGWKK